MRSTLNIAMRTDATQIPRKDGALGALVWAAFLVSAVWIVVLQFIEWPAPLYPVVVSNSSIDAAAYAYAGELLRHGGAPYLAYWDHKPPLIHFINAVGLSLSQGRIWGVWLMSLMTLLIALTFAVFALRRAWGALGALFGTVFFAFSLKAILAFNMTEEFVLPLQWGAVLLVTSWAARRKREFLIGFALGLVGAMAFLLRANLIGAMVASGVTLSLVLLGERRIAAWLRLLAGSMSGAALICAAILGFLAFRGSLPQFWEQVFYYNSLYTSTTWWPRLVSAYGGLEGATQYGTLLFPFAGWVLAIDRLRRLDRRDPGFPLFLLAAVWLPIELLLTSISGRQYGHYFMPLFSPLAFLAALCIDQITGHITFPSVEAIGRHAERITVALAAALALFPMIVTLQTARDRGLAPQRHQQILPTVEYIRSHTRPDSTLLVWGHAADVYLFSERQAATRFIYPLPLLTPRYADGRLVQDFLDEVTRSAPAIIVDAAVPDPDMRANSGSEMGAGEDLVPSLSRWNSAWRYPNSSTWKGGTYWEMTPQLKTFYDFVDQHYEKVATIGPKRWVIYQRRNVTSTAYDPPGR